MSLCLNDFYFQLLWLGKLYMRHNAMKVTEAVSCAQMLQLMKEFIRCSNVFLFDDRSGLAAKRWKIDGSHFSSFDSVSLLSFATKASESLYHFELIPSSIQFHFLLIAKQFIDRTTSISWQPHFVCHQYSPCFIHKCNNIAIFPLF